MIVFDLRCAYGHVFEAWFGSSDAYEEQRAGGRLACPICGDAAVDKAVMAPAVGRKGNAVSPDVAKAAMSALAAAQAKALERSEWVGAGFARRARAMHAGEETLATIHGQASPAEAKALVEEGVPIAPLPLPIVPPDRIN